MYSLRSTATATPGSGPGYLDAIHGLGADEDGPPELGYDIFISRAPIGPPWPPPAEDVSSVTC